jgi:hypothetical protein
LQPNFGGNVPGWPLPTKMAAKLKIEKRRDAILITLYSEKMNAFSHLRLFDACVKPILLYCSEIWSLDILIKRNLNFESKYDSFVPNKTQIKFAKFVLVVPISASKSFILEHKPSLRKKFSWYE